ncbi:MAG: YbhB/YbcL family Raf kinase inhibitor-like protein [Ignavibacteriales bacterium]|nr:YbhB/YbcL family Raf kinase inhibitor-like protein [Ignavibacteriales bacterium]
MVLKSNAFPHEGKIPKLHTCDGKHASPQLSWTDVPNGTKTIALICDDPDAPGRVWVHWVVFNIPASVSELPENMLKTRVLPNGASQGVNTSRGIGYEGPCPPKGTHRYFFKLYAVDTDLPLQPGCTKDDVLKAVEGHILAEAQVMGTYARS